MSSHASDTASSDELERLRAQLAQCETRLAELQRLAQFGYWERDFAEDRAWWSGELRRILGLPPDAPAVTVAEGLAFIHPEDRQLAEQMYRKVVETGEPVDFEHRILWPDGTVRVLRSTGRGIVGPSGAVSRVLGAVQDVTERKAAESRLAEKEQLLSESQRIAHIGGWSWNATGPTHWTNEAYRIYGVSPETFTPTVEALINLVHPEDRPAMQRWIEDSMAGAKPGDLEFRAVMPDGAVRFLSGRGEIEFDAANRPMRMSGTVQDITARKQLEHALFESEARLRRLFESVPLGVVVVENDWRFSLVNPAWERMSGYSAEELTQMSALDLTHPDDRPVAQRMAASADTGNLNEFVLDKRYLRKNGEVLWARLVCAILHDEHGAVTGRVGVIEDISQQRQAELRRSERLRVQRDALVREVHHRIKNHLQGVAGLLERHAAAHPAFEEVIDEVLRQLNVLAAVHGLESSQSGRELDLFNLISDIVDSLRAVSTVPLEFALPQASVPCAISRDEAVPVALILNELVSNAVKHVAPYAAHAGVKIDLSYDGACTLITVRNSPARLPSSFDFSNPGTLGTGLRLARSLLPVDGTTLSFRQSEADVVESTLALWSPVIRQATVSEIEK